MPYTAIISIPIDISGSRLVDSFCFGMSDKLTVKIVCSAGSVHITRFTVVRTEYAVAHVVDRYLIDNIIRNTLFVLYIRFLKSDFLILIGICTQRSIGSFCCINDRAKLQERIALVFRIGKDFAFALCHSILFKIA